MWRALKHANKLENGIGVNEIGPLIEIIMRISSPILTKSIRRLLW